MGDVTGQDRTILIELSQPLDWEKAEFCKDGIKASAPMALAQNEAVSLRPLRMTGIHSQHAPIEHSQQVGHGKRSADMGALGAMSHAEDVLSNLLRQDSTNRKVRCWS